MHWLGAALTGTVATALTAEATGWVGSHRLLAAFLALAAVAAFRARPATTFYRVLMALFGCEAVASTLFVLARESGLAPEGPALLSVPEPVVMTLALFVTAFRGLSAIPTVHRALTIVDRYFRSPEHAEFRLGGLRLAVPDRLIARVGVVLIVLAGQTLVLIQIQMLHLSARFMDALQAYDGETFWHTLLVSITLWTLPYLLASLLESVLTNLLVVRWRRALSRDYARRWIGSGAHYRMTLCGLGTDNPDQRIQEDVAGILGNGSVTGVVNLTLRLISDFSSLLAFALILWSLSARISPFGSGLQVPGALLWFAILYAGSSTLATFLIGRPLIRLSFERQHVEADYRYGLARLREYGEPIALMSGGATEVAIADGLFERVERNAYVLALLGGAVALATMLIDLIGGKLPYIALGALFLAKGVTLGDLTQASVAFAQVSGTLGFFAARFTSLAELKAIIDRLGSFDEALDRTQPCAGGTLLHEARERAITLANVTIRLPDDRTLAEDISLRLEAGENVLVTGPSGTGKSTLFRVLAGIWPHWDGIVSLPEGASLLVLPQTVYLPVGSLRTAVSYPRRADAFARQTVAAALAECGLGHLVDALDRDENWSQTLSGGERQRLAIARALLAAPDWLLLDEATSAMDPDLERQVYETLRRRLPDTTLVSIGHRDGLAVHHARRIHVLPEGDGFRLAHSARAA